MKTETALEVFIGKAPKSGSPLGAADIQVSDESFSDCFGLCDVSPEDLAAALVPDTPKGVATLPDLPLMESDLGLQKIADQMPAEIPSLKGIPDLPATLPAAAPPSDALVVDVDTPVNPPADHPKSEDLRDAALAGVQGDVTKEPDAKRLNPNADESQAVRPDTRLPATGLENMDQFTAPAPGPDPKLVTVPIAAQPVEGGGKDAGVPATTTIIGHPQPKQAKAPPVAPTAPPIDEHKPPLPTRADVDTPTPINKTPPLQSGQSALKAGAPGPLQVAGPQSSATLNTKPAQAAAEKVVAYNPVESPGPDRHRHDLASKTPTSVAVPSAHDTAKPANTQVSVPTFEMPVRPIVEPPSNWSGKPMDVATVTTAAVAEPKVAASNLGPQVSVPAADLLLHPLADDDARLPRHGGELGLAELSQTPGQTHAGAVPKHADPLEHLPRMTATIAEAARALSNGPVEIALNPEELGRVRMTLHVTDTSMMVAVSVDRPDTLDLLRRNIDMLVSSLREMGYDDVTLSYQDGGGDLSHGEDPSDPEVQAGAGMNSATEIPPDNVPVARLHLGGSGGVDIRI